MPAVIRRQVTVRSGGRVTLASPRLRAGCRAEVVVYLNQPRNRTRKVQRHSRRPAAPGTGPLKELLKSCGALRTGKPQAYDNESIDADLARSYLETHAGERK